LRVKKAEFKRSDGRKPGELRPIEFTRAYTRFSPGSVLIRTGHTVVLCTASIDEKVPEWMAGRGRGWVTAEYDMLPGSTGQRRQRSRRGLDGRATEIQRLIGRVLRAVVDFNALGERTIWLDCDVLQADGGTRTAAITGSYMALSDACQWLIEKESITRSPIIGPVAAVSVGKVDGQVLIDLDYSEDSRAEVDANVAMTASGEFVEVQVSAEAGTYSRSELDDMLTVAAEAIQKLFSLQRKALGGGSPSRSRRSGSKDKP
jgi:ribonuclease PH